MCWLAEMKLYTTSLLGTQECWECGPMKHRETDMTAMATPIWLDDAVKLRDSQRKPLHVNRHASFI